MSEIPFSKKTKHRTSAFSFVSSASVRDRCGLYCKILFFQQRKLKWEKVKGAVLSFMEISTAGNGGGGRPEAISKQRKIFQGRDLGLGFMKLSSLFVVVLICKRILLIQQSTLGSERIIIAGTIHFVELSQQANEVYMLYPFYRVR